MEPVFLGVQNGIIFGVDRKIVFFGVERFFFGVAGGMPSWTARLPAVCRAGLSAVCRAGRLGAGCLARWTGARNI